VLGRGLTGLGPVAVRGDDLPQPPGLGLFMLTSKNCETSLALIMKFFLQLHGVRDYRREDHKNGNGGARVRNPNGLPGVLSCNFKSVFASAKTFDEEPHNNT
jgi:hypothetical protein